MKPSFVLMLTAALVVLIGGILTASAVDSPVLAVMVVTVTTAVGCTLIFTAYRLNRW